MFSLDYVVAPKWPCSVIQNHSFAMLSSKPSLLGGMLSCPTGSLPSRLLPNNLFLNLHDEVWQLLHVSSGVLPVDQPGFRQSP